MTPNATSNTYRGEINIQNYADITHGAALDKTDAQKHDRYSDDNLLQDQSEQSEEEGPTNEYLLNVAFISFLGFTLLQGTVAFVAQSQAMIGDTSAMAVDAMTYLFNMYAERQKNKPIKDDGITSLAVRKRERKMLRLKLEIVPPLISVVCLVGVTCSVMSEAISALIDTSQVEEEDQPNVNLMFFFSSLNLALDIFNVGCFARAKKALGYLVIKKDIERYGDDKECIKPLTPAFSRHKRSIVDVESDTDAPSEGSASYSTISEHGYEMRLSSDGDVIDDEEGDINLNMCSAYTHVFADTLRSVTVFILAGLAGIFQNISPEKADAVAAIAVSFIIIFSLGPLVKGLIDSFIELRALSKKASESKEREAELLLVV